MAKLNTKRTPTRTHEGAKAKQVNPEMQLKRAVMACLLWEKQFYESGEDIADRIASLVPMVSAYKVAGLATMARKDMKLRHAPLLIAREMARHESHKFLAGMVISDAIQRADELAEFLSIYWKDGKQPLSAQVKKGLAVAFAKFDAYQLAKYNRGYTIKLRDVMFLCHPKPKSGEQAEVWKQLAEGTLASPDTWEVGLSSGEDKRTVWERLLSERKMGAMAILRNLRNFQRDGVNDFLIRESIRTMRADRVLPFRFIAASRFAPHLEPDLEKAMFRGLENSEKLSGRTVLLADVSGSMGAALSTKSDMDRRDAAYGLAMVLREITDDLRVFTFSRDIVEVPPRRGFALRDAMHRSQAHATTYLGKAVRSIDKSVPYDRLIVITDEQSDDPVPDPKGQGYMINIASYANGVGYGAWHHIDGFSEAVVDWVRRFEAEFV